MKTHQLKIQPQFFHSILYGDKKFEVRKNDRDFKVGDTLLLREYEASNRYTGNFVYVEVLYILYGGFGLKKRFVCMTIEVMHSDEIVHVHGF